MRKLKLSLDELSVVSFDASTRRAEEGTVRGREDSDFSEPWSCFNTCVDTNCGQTYCRTSPCAC